MHLNSFLEVFLFNFYFFLCFSMAAAQEFGESGQNVVEAGPAEAVANTVKEVQTLLEATSDSLQALCRRVEEATTKNGVQGNLAKSPRGVGFLFGLALEISK